MNLNELGDMIIDDRDPEEIFEILDLLGKVWLTQVRERTVLCRRRCTNQRAN